MNHDQDPPDSAFDLRTRAELALAYDPGDPPVHLLRHTRVFARRGFQRSIVVLLLLGSGVGGVLAMRPAELVRGAIEHEYYERTLRGTFMEARPLLAHLGLDQSKSVPGFPQLMRPCDIDGHLVYHLTTFFEKGGMVTVFAFDEPVAMKENSASGGAGNQRRSQCHGVKQSLDTSSCKTHRTGLGHGTTPEHGAPRDARPALVCLRPIGQPQSSGLSEWLRLSTQSRGPAICPVLRQFQRVPYRRNTEH